MAILTLPLPALHNTITLPALHTLTLPGFLPLGCTCWLHLVLSFNLTSLLYVLFGTFWSKPIKWRFLPYPCLGSLRVKQGGALAALAPSSV